MTVTVNDGGAKICTPNSITFNVITPTISYYNADGNVYHVAGFATIGRLADTYLGPSAVSFDGVYAKEVSGSFVATGAWACRTTHTATLAGPASLGYNASYGYELGTDVDLIVSCDQTNPYNPDQYQTSNATISIPTQFGPPGQQQGSAATPYYMNTVVMQVTDDPSGDLTISKDHMAGNTSVSNPSEGI